MHIKRTYLYITYNMYVCVQLRLDRYAEATEFKSITLIRIT